MPCFWTSGFQNCETVNLCGFPQPQNTNTALKPDLRGPHEVLEGAAGGREGLIFT